MVKEKSVGAVVFSEKDGERKFLLLHYTAGHWGFPKGHVENQETEEQTLLREIREETALENVKVLPGFREYTKYFFKRGEETVFKEVIFYLVNAGEINVKISLEHQGFEWLPLEKAMQKLSFKNTKQVLEKAVLFLSKSTQSYV